MNIISLFSFTLLMSLPAFSTTGGETMRVQKTRSRIPNQQEIYEASFRCYEALANLDSTYHQKPLFTFSEGQLYRFDGSTIKGARVRDGNFTNTLIFNGRLDSLELSSGDGMVKENGVGSIPYYTVTHHDLSNARAAVQWESDRIFITKSPSAFKMNINDKDQLLLETMRAHWILQCADKTVESVNRDFNCGQLQADIESLRKTTEGSVVATYTVDMSKRLSLTGGQAIKSLIDEIIRGIVRQKQMAWQRENPGAYLTTIHNSLTDACSDLDTRLQTALFYNEEDVGKLYFDLDVLNEEPQPDPIINNRDDDEAAAQGSKI